MALRLAWRAQMEPLAAAVRLLCGDKVALAETLMLPAQPRLRPVPVVGVLAATTARREQGATAAQVTASSRGLADVALR